MVLVILCLKKLKIILLFSLILLIFISYKIQNNYKKPNSNKLVGTITNYKITASKITIEIKNKNKYIAYYYIKSDNELNYLKNKIKLGDKMVLNGEYNEAPLNRNFNLFNYKNYLKSKKIYYVFNAKKYIIYTQNSLKYNVKNTLIKRINKSKNKNYLKLFILGENNLDNRVKESFKINGISHLFAISGMHITIFTSFILLILNKLSKNKMLNFIVLLLFLLLYMFLVNYTPSVIRASLFFLILNIKKIFNLNISNFELIIFLLLILLIYNPFYIYHLGFLCSFIISITLIYFSDNLKQNNYFKTLFMTSLISFLISIPITINNNFEINLLTPFINLIFVPLISFIIFPLSLLNFVFLFFDPILNTLINLLELLSITVSNIKTLNIILCKIPFYVVIIYYAFIIYIIKNISFKKIIVLITVLLIHSNINYLNKYPIITMIDVNQGDSILIELPHNHANILVDTGGNYKYDISKNTTIPYLKSIGVKKIDYLILTHGDLDHSGEAINLIKNFKVKNVLFNSGRDNEIEIEIKNLLNKKNINYKNIDIYNLYISKYKFSFINNKNKNENEDSLVFYTKLNNYKLLFTGDIGSVTENKLLKEYKLEKVDILKIAHHGSKNSSSYNFIKQIKPKYALISAGVNNRFNHPNIETINNLNKVKSKIYSTNINGMIRIVLKKDIDIKSVY